ncbi:MAG: ribonuclease Y [Clostridia bacterium]|nr:ribonuclease Y [Clostridia bacterium]
MPTEVSLLVAVCIGAAALAVGAVVAGLIAYRAGIRHRMKVAEAQIGSAEKEAERIVADAHKKAEADKKEALVKAKDEIYRLRNESEKEIKERRSEVQHQERRLQQKEEALDRKVENYEKKEETLAAKIKEVDGRIVEVDALKKSQMDLLERLSGLSQEQAKEYLLSSLTQELEHEKALKLTEFDAQLKAEADMRARTMISHAIQRVAADQVAETTVSVVPLPNDEMKGRIIGREGRNIRAIETLTGIDLIIDDTPEAITLSGFDPVRREIARIAMERLISDGRIHPARIEEMVNKARKEVENTIKAEGERAVLETGLRGINPDVVKLLGRLHYRTSYGQNVLNHSMEVAFLSGIMASELGIDPEIARRAGLLHDIGKAVDHQVEGSHIEIGVDIARKYKESEAVVHAIQAHHGDVEAQTVVACLVQAADAISAARPGARRENLENYIKRLEKLEELANSFEGVERSFAIQAGREVRIIVQPDKVNDDQMVILAREIAKKIESNMDYPGQIKVNLIRENRAVDYAK